jgi:hypothetical protein
MMRDRLEGRQDSAASVRFNLPIGQRPHSGIILPELPNGWQGQHQPRQRHRADCATGIAADMQAVLLADLRGSLFRHSRTE